MICQRGMLLLLIGVGLPTVMLRIYAFVHDVEPSLPENITCISENFQNLVCSFSKPSTTYISMNWSMEYSFGGSNFETSTVNGICPSTEDSLVMVHCSLNDEHVLIYMNYIVTLHMYNTLYGLSKKMTVEIVLDDSIVRPNVVDNLNVTQWENNRGVNISWTPTHDLPSTVELIYRVTLHNQWGEQKSWVCLSVCSSIKSVLDLRPKGIKSRHKIEFQPWANFGWKRLVSKKDITNTGLMLTDLIPYTNYSFEVKCKPVRAVGEVYWSTPAIRNFTTHPDLPAVGPIVAEGAFVQRNCGTEVICLVLYWKNPPARQINGALVGYKIIIASNMNNESLYNMKSEIQNPVSIERNELLCTETNGERTSVEVSFHFPNQTDFVASIALMNTVGLSKPSFIVIPSLQEVAPKPDLVIVEEGENNFQVSWIWDNRNLSVTTVTYFWCTRNRLRANTTLLCEGTLGTHSVQSSVSSDWKSFTLNRNNVIIPTSNQSSLYFAVALVQNETSGGMVWQGCKFLKGKAPNKPAYQVNPLETNGTLLQIEIPRVLLCQADNAGRPETYMVSYKQVVDDYKEDNCPQDGFSNQTFEVQLEREIQHYTLSGLKEGGSYIVCLGSANRDSQTIQYGPSVVIKMAKPESERSLPVSIIIGITVASVCSAGIVVTLFSYFCLKRVKRCVKRPAIIVPDVHHFKTEEVEIYIEVDDLKKTGSKANEINNKNGGLDADSGTGGSVESSCNEDDIEETKYVAPERRDSETSSGGSASYERLVKATSTFSGNLNEAYEQHHLDRRTNSDSLMKFVMDNAKIITSPECHQVYPVTATSGSDGNSAVQSYVVAALPEGRNSSEYLPDIDLDRLKLAQKETLKPCIDNPITSLPLKTLADLHDKLNTDWKEQSVHSWLEPQSMAEKMTIKVVPVPCDGSYVQATFEENKKDKRDEEEVEVEEQEDGLETSWEENKSSDHHLESADDALCDRVIESLLDSGSTTVIGYVKPIETNLGSGAFCMSDASSGFSGSLMPVYIKPAEVTLANNQYLSGMDLSCDEVASIEEIPGNFRSGEPQESSNSQRQSFLNNAASYIQETPGISISKSHSRDETGSECPSRDEGTASNNYKCQSKDRILAVNAYTSDCMYNIKEENHSLHDECHLEKEISRRNNKPETCPRGETPKLNGDNFCQMQGQTC